MNTHAQIIGKSLIYVASCAAKKSLVFYVFIPNFCLKKKKELCKRFLALVIQMLHILPITEGSWSSPLLRDNT